MRVTAQRGSDAAQISTDQQFLQTAEPRLLANDLTGDRIVLVTEPGASSTVISGIKQAAGLAGATVTGQVALQPAFNDLSGASESTLYQINSNLASTDQTTLAPPSAQKTAYQQQAAQLIATAILATTTAGETQGISNPDAQTLLEAYDAGRLPHYQRRPLRPRHARRHRHPDDRPRRRPERPGQPGAARGGAAVRHRQRRHRRGRLDGRLVPVRQRDLGAAVQQRLQQMSSVDNADTTIGQVSTIWALADQLRGVKASSYGISGAAAVSPEPPVPIATPSATPTPHADEDRKGRQVREEEVSHAGRAAAVGALPVGVASAVAARAAYRALRRYPPAGDKTWTRTNHRRELVSLLEGPAVAFGAITAELIAAAVAGRQGKGQIPQSSERTVGSRSALALAVAGGGALGFGVLDDLAGSGKRRGLAATSARCGTAR